MDQCIISTSKNRYIWNWGSHLRVLQKFCSLQLSSGDFLDPANHVITCPTVPSHSSNSTFYNRLLNLLLLNIWQILGLFDTAGIQLQALSLILNPKVSSLLLWSQFHSSICSFHTLVRVPLQSIRFQLDRSLFFIHLKSTRTPQD